MTWGPPGDLSMKYWYMLLDNGLSFTCQAKNYYVQLAINQKTSLPEKKYVVSPRGDHSGCALVIARRGETTHMGVDVNNTHLSMVNPLSNSQPNHIL